MVITGYKPEKLFYYFEELSKIPRGSGNEEAASKWICNFAKNLGLESIRDSYNNVFVRMPASPGYEDRPAVLLQGHMDMVCEKNADSGHDFTKDPLKLKVNDGWLSAEGTTLGGDDGIAVAIMMTVLEDKTLSHPELECLFTTSEETGLTGAFGFDYSLVKAENIINLDSEAEGIVTVSCAGSADSILEYHFDRVKTQGRSIRINVKGLAGGHSGAEIHLGHLSALRVMGRLLARLYDDTPFNLVDLRGGNKRNAIPREAFAEISVLDEEKAKEIILDEERRISSELCADDAGFRVHVSRGKVIEKVIAYKDTSAIINMLTVFPNGVYAMSTSVKDFVRTSSNIGIASTSEDSFAMDVMSRSSCDTEWDSLLLTFKRAAKLIGAQIRTEGKYSGWESSPDSELAKLYCSVYREKTGKEPVVCGIHAGLECGVIISSLNHNATAISIGPDMEGIHSPSERLFLPSCENTYAILVKMLERL